MGLFGKKSKDDGGDDANRSSLFGKKNNATSASTNPYAQSSVAPDPYTEAKQKAYGGSSQPQQGYGGAGDAGRGTRGGYGADTYGAQGGYGADRYGNSDGGKPAQTSRYGAGGYGGLGGKDGFEADDESRSALFGGAQERVQQQQKIQPPGGYGGPPSYDQSGGYGGEYGAPPGPTYQDRQMTAEEEEEEDVKATKQQIRFMKREDVSSTRNALRIAQQAEETGRDTLARLGAQGEHIHNTEKNLELAHNQNRLAEEKARELKTLNGSMFAIHVSNPFTSNARREARDQEVINKHVEQREAREAMRANDYAAHQRLSKTFKDVNAAGGAPAQQKTKNLAERAKYQFEADSEDEEMENEIDSNLDALAGATGRLNLLARATGAEVDEQNRHLDRISKTGDRVDIGIAANRARLDRF